MNCCKPRSFLTEEWEGCFHRRFPVPFTRESPRILFFSTARRTDGEREAQVPDRGQFPWLRLVTEPASHAPLPRPRIPRPLAQVRGSRPVPATLDSMTLVVVLFSTQSLWPRPSPNSQWPRTRGRTRYTSANLWPCSARPRRSRFQRSGRAHDRAYVQGIVLLFSSTSLFFYCWGWQLSNCGFQLKLMTT